MLNPLNPEFPVTPVTPPSQEAVRPRTEVTGLHASSFDEELAIVMIETGS